MTSFIGREHDAEEIGRLLQTDEVRLLTLTGPGGVGKTRLALRVAANLHSNFADGAYFVALAPVNNPDMVLTIIAQTLGVYELGGQAVLNSLCSALQNKHLLLILDNFEQVLAAGPQVVELLLCTPRVQVLVTSRSVLRVYGEHEYMISPLALPVPWQQSTFEQLTQYEAVRLFIERARAAKPGFAINNESAPAVAEICHRLDGLPLAIELAAAHIKLLSPQALLRRLDRRLPLLTGGAANLPRRHQTLRNSIAWSYDLLTESEKELFRSLSVFVGGCTLEAAQAICSTQERDDQHSASRTPQLDDMAALVDKSLLRHDEQEDGEVRFSMLETIREFAFEELAASGQESATAQRHARFFRQLVERIGPEIEGANQSACLDKLAIEYDNLRAALSWTQRSGDIETGLRIAGPLFHFWYIRGYFSEGRRWLSELLAQEGDAPPAVRALALNALGNLSGAQSDYVAARECHEQVLALWQTAGNQQGVAIALSNLGNAARLLGEYDRATALFERALAIQKELGQKRLVALTLHNLSMVAWAQGKYEEARRRCEGSLLMHRELGHKQGTAMSLHSLGTIATSEGNYEEARTFYQECLSLARELGDKAEEARALQGLGETIAYEGDYQAARAVMSSSLRAFYELGTRRGVVSCLQSLAVVEREHAEPRRLVSLLAAAEALRLGIGAPVTSHERGRYGQWLERARSKLGSEAFAEAWEQGKVLSMEEAVALALEASPIKAEALAALARDTSSPAITTYSPGSDLTAREIEVLRLVAVGLTNPGIAAYLHISINTVQTHLRSIFSKVNVTTRAAAVRYAFEHNLS